MTRVSKPSLETILALLRWLVVALAALAICQLAGVVLLRARYPFELEWIESATVNASQWVLDGHALYGRPQLEFVPLLYTPLYFYLSAALTVMVGPGFLGPRLVSLLAMLGAGWVIFDLVRHETGQRWPGLAAAGFYAATFQVTGAWMDVARSDSLLVFLLLLAAYVTRRFPGWRGALACAVVLNLAYLAKQSALPFFVAFGFYYLLQARPEWLTFWPIALGLLVGTASLLNALTQGWYGFYTWYLVRQTVLDAQRIKAFWLMDMLGHVPWALLCGLLALVGLGNPLDRSPAGARSRFYVIFAAGSIAASWWNRAAAGAHTNTLMPAMACLGLLIGLLLGLWAPRQRPALARGAGLLLVIAQFLQLAYDPRLALPTARDTGAGQEFITQLRNYPGDVFVPAHSYYAAMAGKPTFAHWATITDASGLWDTNLDVQHGGVNDPRRSIILDEITAAIAARRFSAVILDDNNKEFAAYWRTVLDPYYRAAGTVFADDNVFWTKSGAASRPQLIFVPK